MYLQQILTKTGNPHRHGHSQHLHCCPSSQSPSQGRFKVFALGWMRHSQRTCWRKCTIESVLVIRELLSQLVRGIGISWMAFPLSGYISLIFCTGYTMTVPNDRNSDTCTVSWAHYPGRVAGCLISKAINDSYSYPTDQPQSSGPTLTSDSRLPYHSVLPGGDGWMESK